MPDSDRIKAFKLALKTLVENEAFRAFMLKVLIVVATMYYFLHKDNLATGESIGELKKEFKELKEIVISDIRKTNKLEIQHNSLSEVVAGNTKDVFILKHRPREGKNGY